jgi:hypothetical protein
LCLKRSEEYGKKLKAVVAVASWQKREGDEL